MKSRLCVELCLALSTDLAFTTKLKKRQFLFLAISGKLIKQLFRALISQRSENNKSIKNPCEDALKDYLKALQIDSEAVEGPGLGTVILNYKFKSSSVKERALYIYEQLKLPKNERVLKIKELDEGQVMHKPGKL